MVAIKIPKQTVAGKAKAKAAAKAKATPKQPAAKPTNKRKSRAKPKKAKPLPKAVGRPAIVLDVETTRTLAAQGLTEQQIADAMKVNIKTLVANRKRYEDFQAALTEGKSQGIAAMTNAVFRMGTAGNFQAAKYYLNNRDPSNWKERVDHHVEGDIAVYADEADLRLAGLMREQE